MFMFSDVNRIAQGMWDDAFPCPGLKLPDTSLTDIKGDAEVMFLESQVSASKEVH